MSDNWGEAIKGADREYWNGKDSPANVGDERIGQVLRIEAGIYKEKPTTNYIIALDDGRECWLPNHVLLNSALSKVKVGQRIKVVYRGAGEKLKKGKNPAEKYDVYVSDAPRQASIMEMPKSAPQNELIKKIVDNLKFGQDMFPGHVIPEANVKAACGDDATFQHLKDAGLITQSSSVDAPKGVTCYRVT